MSARFEIVRTDAPQPWHARFVAANGRVVWTTENYAREAGVRRAVLLFADFIARGGAAWDGKHWIQHRRLGHIVGEFHVEYIDEREATHA